MRWEKRGLIFKTEANFPWMRHHASNPVADKISEKVVRIYFGPRDERGRTQAAYIEVDADDPSRVLYVHDRPVLALGKLGTFDDSGVMPSCLVNRDGRKYLFYTGWNQGVTVPYRNSIGLAVSADGGVTFERVFEGPVLDRTRFEPYFCATPYAMIDEGRWRLWYASSTGFRIVDSKPEPVYQVKYADSADGFAWDARNTTCLEYGFEGEANARPCVVKQNGIYRMWYCYRGSAGYRTDKRQSYRIGYAESDDGVRWTRMDPLVGIGPSEEGWDSMMIGYPFIYEHRGMKHMLYNGNGFGESGFGYAVLTDDDGPFGLGTTGRRS
jgi:hypothetical protein